jgi:DNA-binding MarR family transcriptional regulator
MTRPSAGKHAAESILTAAHRVRRSLDADLRPSGLSLSTFKLLRALAARDRSMREISEALYISPRTVTDLIDGLERRGLVERLDHPTDRRITLLHLSDAGHEQLAAATIHADRSNQAAVANLTEPERQLLSSLLARIAVD